ncbi:MAG: YraN family protein [Planctomycetota bacterium]
MTGWLDRLRGRSSGDANHLRRGRRGERLAARHLKKNGYRVLARNLRSRHGEIDLVAASPDGAVVIVEVKAGGANPAFPPELHVTPAKQGKLVALAAAIARRHRLTQRRIRFDVVAVEFPDVGPPTLRHHTAAFESHV